MHLKNRTKVIKPYQLTEKNEIKNECQRIK